MRKKKPAAILTACSLLCLSLLSNACGKGADEESKDAAVVYTVTDGAVNGAGGSVGIRQKTEIESLKTYKLYWGDKNGIFDDYLPLGSTDAPTAGESVTYEIDNGIAIPAEATHIWVLGYTKRGSEPLMKAKTSIPKNAKKTSEKLYEFQVFSDYQTQRTNDSYEMNQRTIAAFADIKSISPQTSMVINNGDVVEWNAENLYRQFFKDAQKGYGGDLPQMYFTLGNHELTQADIKTPGDYETDVTLWNKYTSEYNGTNDIYFSKVINGSYFIFLGPIELVNSAKHSSLGYVDARLGHDQIVWLEATLKEAAKTGKPIYTFMHQPLEETVSGSLYEEYMQEWFGITKKDSVTGEWENDELRSLFDQYPQLLHFTSHTHWHLESTQAWLPGNGEKANYFNTASVGYLWQGTGSGSNYDGGEGLFVEVYKDYVLVRGRHFNIGEDAKNQWIASAQFVVPV